MTSAKKTDTRGKKKQPISNAHAADLLEAHNRWRRGVGIPSDPFDLGLSIELAVKALRGEL